MKWGIGGVKSWDERPLRGSVPAASFSPNPDAQDEC